MAGGEHVVDAGPLVSLIDASDRDHGWSKRALGGLHPPLVTCEAVLSEALFLLRKDPAAPRKISVLFERGLLVSHPILDSEPAPVFALMQTYRDVPMSLADACVVRLSEKIRGATVITLDSDFSIYRRHRREKISLLLPPRLRHGS